MAGRRGASCRWLAGLGENACYPSYLFLLDTCVHPYPLSQGTKAFMVGGRRPDSVSGSFISDLTSGEESNRISSCSCRHPGKLARCNLPLSRSPPPLHPAYHWPDPEHHQLLLNLGVWGSHNILFLYLKFCLRCLSPRSPVLEAPP